MNDRKGEVEKMKRKPISFYIGWVGISVLGINEFFFSNRFLYSDGLSFLTSNFSGLLVFLFFFLLALEVVTFDLRRKENKIESEKEKENT
ncbi:hypothetical protein JTF06_09570 [Desemzia sp. RIT804]|uniref:hypothetical protein n=1 Tax=Desemzia sp. RIT 804 TaxID=2810209 RepID=UPI001951923A|nr:hypothetical protein [Desemzia sp. RIT 804]MBM6615134.1 hypothetical protein [Desemzia sp. RIT 804]